MHVLLVDRKTQLYTEFDVVEYPPKLPNSLTSACKDVVTTRTKALTEAEFSKFLDNDGRLVDEHRLRRAVFRGKFLCFNLFRTNPMFSCDRSTVNVICLSEYTHFYNIYQHYE